MKNVIILPTYNERENIEKIIRQIFYFVPDIYILVADDNSPDGTAEVVNKLKFEYSSLSLISRPKKEGLGKAYIEAFNYLLSDLEVKKIIMMDSDFSHQPKYLPEMLKKGLEYDVVIGSRYVRGGGTLGWELWRRLLSFFGNFYCMMVTGMPVHDLTAGFNVINSDLLRKIDFRKLDMSGYAFIMQLKYMLYKQGARFYEVPIIFVNRIAGESKMSGHIISEGIFAPIRMVFSRD